MVPKQKKISKDCLTNFDKFYYCSSTLNEVKIAFHSKVWVNARNYLSLLMRLFEKLKRPNFWFWAQKHVFTTFWVYLAIFDFWFLRLTLSVPELCTFWKKKFKSFAPTSCVSKTSVNGEGRPKTSLFSSKFHALSNGSYENSGNGLVPEI